MSPTPRAALLVAVAAAMAVLVPVPVALLAVVAVAAATLVDALSVRTDPRVSRRLGAVLARGVPTALEAETSPARGRARVRQPVPPYFDVEPAEADGRLDAVVTAHRRGRHPLADPAVRLTGPLGLGRWYHGGRSSSEVVVYPDLPAARRLAQAVRQGKVGADGRRVRGPLGLGTDFESVREYVPDDDVRRINWRATARLSRPMTNQYRVDQNRDVVCLVDTGRLMAAPLGDRSRLDAALDAVAAVAVVADEVGDRCGVVAFDTETRREVRPRRGGARAVVDATFDLEPRPVDSDYELAFTAVARSKRSFVLLITDLLDESAARALLDAVPILARRHVVAVATVADPDLAGLIATPPATAVDVYAAAVAHDVLDARAGVSARLARAGAEVVEAGPDAFSAACVTTYLRAKHRARL
ncbi:MAG TPA: DUF58 domain-containing protein [Acidimicrobiales bacterium]|nr:DUF58 domain-containing protein [Acidimicrobiales bacterium]